MVKEKLKEIPFSKKSHKFRKFLSIILFIAMFIGWTFLIGYNLYVGYATSQIRIHPEGFGESMPDNSTIELGGSFKIQNDHLISISIRDITITSNITTDDNTEISYYTNTTSVPRQTNATISFVFIFLNASDPVKFLEIGTALNATTYLHFDLSLSFGYGLYSIYANIKLQTEFEGLS